MKRIQLYATCPACEGHGRVRDHQDGPREAICDACRGKGFRPTPEGQAIIRLTRAAGAEEMLPDEGV